MFLPSSNRNRRFFGSKCKSEHAWCDVPGDYLFESRLRAIRLVISGCLRYETIQYLILCLTSMHKTLLVIVSDPLAHIPFCLHHSREVSFWFNESNSDHSSKRARGIKGYIHMMSSYSLWYSVKTETTATSTVQQALGVPRKRLFEQSPSRPRKP